MRKSWNYLVIAAIGALLVAAAFFSEQQASYTVPELAANASKRCQEKLEMCQRSAATAFSAGLDSLWQEPLKIYEQERIGLYVFRNDSLKFWNNSQIPLHEKPSFFKSRAGLARLEQGYYLYTRTDSLHLQVLTLAFVKPAYALENNYLKNEFLSWTGIPPGIKIDTARTPGTTVQVGETNLFSLKGNEERYFTEDATELAVLLFFSGYCLLLCACLLFAAANRTVIGLFTIGSLLAGFRWTMIAFHWPEFLYRSSLYDLQLFGNAQSFLNGFLGDILLNALALCTLVFVFYFYFSAGKAKVWWLEPLFSLLALFVLLNQFNQTAISLIKNSTLSFDFLAIFSIKPQVFIGLAALGVYSAALFVLVYRAGNYLQGSPLVKTIKAFIFFGIPCVLEQGLAGGTLFESYWLFLYALLLFVLLSLVKIDSALALGVQIILIAFVSSRIFMSHIRENQAKDLDILSFELSERQDQILENEFGSVPRKISEDRDLRNLLNLVRDLPDVGREINQLLKQKYFGGYFDRYAIDFSLFDKDCRPLLPVKQAVTLNEGYFEDQIKNYGDTTFVEDLYLVKNARKNSQYIGKIVLDDLKLYILMEPKQFEELGSFPDLLLDRAQQKPERLKDFSHAVYRTRQLSNRYGDFSYPFFQPDSITLASTNLGFVHYFFYPDEDTTVIISQERREWSYFFTFNSYLLLFFALMLIATYLLYSWGFARQYRSPTLTRRIQTIIILLLILAMTAVGITSGRLVTRQFERNNEQQLQEKTDIIINELSDQFKAEQLFDETQRELVNIKIREYARLFNTPISLFQADGNLYTTSEPKLYDLGLAAPLVNPTAYMKVGNNRSSSESVNARAGSLKYRSLYTPLFNEKKKISGFLNLPYFARQNDLANELSGIISALINVYVILFVISILSGLILSGFITQPLRIIKQQLSNITLGKQNEKILWQSNDEIGSLVSEYNQMLVKLEQSANLLAQSERESAWREMAKQVAHEIKNPLTPMKLNLQYLQHLMSANPEDFKEKFAKASAGIIEQIDALATIASEFSNFAKLPAAQLQTINLVEIIQTSWLIFESENGIRFTNHIVLSELQVKGDREQCLRVFNNLFKNAIQALEEVENPRLDVFCEMKEHSVVIEVRDNGCGIDDEKKSKVFTPNFTTKNTGSGLGLAMVKNILEGFDGSIWFVSQKNQGTSFYLEFRRA